MKKTLSRKQRFFNSINLTVDDEVHVGIDVHKTNCHIAIRLNGALALTFVAPSDNIAIARMMGKLTPAVKQIVYEAGPTGFSLARALAKASLPVAVVAPSKSPRPSAQQAKSDRLDCRKLAEFAEKDLLDELNYLQTQIKRVQLELKNIYSKERHIRQMEILQSHPGVGPITARQFRAEVFDPARFDKATQLTRYPGLCPHVSQN